MIESVRHFSITEEKVIEKIIQNDHVNINHVILGEGDALPRHEANAPAHLIVVRGTVSLGLGEQAIHEYTKGSIVSVPRGTLMNVSNQRGEALEFFIVKAPGPAFF